MSKKLIIIINGHATVGKDYLINNLDALVLNKSSVDLIKKEAKILDGMEKKMRKDVNS